MSQLEFIRGALEAVADELTIDEKGKLRLPPVPRHDDPVALCRWLTTVFRLDLRHPIIGGVRQGLAGPAGHVELRRADAEPIRFEPASRIDTPQRLAEDLAWRLRPTDGVVYAFKLEHTRQISHVVRMLCGLAEKVTDEQDTTALVDEFLHGAELADRELSTYGNSAQRYEAVVALRWPVDEITGRPCGLPHYLRDADTGEYVIRIGDLQSSARRHVGGSLQHGWLDARMQGIGWNRVRLDGHGRAGGHRGPHGRVDVYRGHLPGTSDVNQDAAHLPTRSHSSNT